MDPTGWAKRLLDPIPAHRTAGLDVVRAGAGAGVVVICRGRFDWSIRRAA
ncbi:hypothetical protein [Actinoplanes sp. L3-i22]|nr:hypothetical protein [Actinoplanes sp. L3-i22]BCY12502.1 hypothetical protein L3i22_075900 [Actinoplanes sp. L3-i22]